MNETEMGILYRWRYLLEKEHESWKNGGYTGRGIFSIPNQPCARVLGEMIHWWLKFRLASIYLNPNLQRSALDIGCGQLILPEYMRDSMHQVQWHGVDPMDITAPDAPQRMYTYTQVTGEKLPYENNTFDLVTIASVLDHTISPVDVLKEAMRVLRRSGALFLWTSIRQRPHYAEQGFYNDHHQWGFTRQCILDLLDKAGYVKVIRYFDLPEPGEVLFMVDV